MGMQYILLSSVCGHCILIQNALAPEDNLAILQGCDLWHIDESPFLCIKSDSLVSIFQLFEQSRTPSL